jgi:uncharacterized protein
VEHHDGAYTFSPSDLTQLLGCGHASALARAAARGERPRKAPVGPYAQLIFDKGDAHEQAYLAALRASGREVVEVGRSGDWAVGAARTAEAMRAATEVIYQAVFDDGRWHGLADFVERVERPSALGAWSYEAVDTKLARVEAQPSHALQLCYYSDGIAAVQGVAPEHAHLVLGSGERKTLRIREIHAYWRRAQRALERVAAEDAPTAPYPCDVCTFCGFRRECEDGWRASDHLSLVAGIGRDQVEQLTTHGIDTRHALGALKADEAIGDLRPATVAGLHQQARLQSAAATADAIPYELLPLDGERGLARLPDPSPGDVMFDIEGDPYFTAAEDLTFLFGLLLAEPDGWRYEAIWAHSPAEEKVAFEQLIDLLHARLAAHPDMHVYHYSHAETSVIHRLIERHATREDEVDDLLRRGVLVDLYGVLRQALRAGVESYSLKNTERLAGFVRVADVGSGSDAVLAYEEWLGTHGQPLLDEIADYNREDCDATRALRGWLLGLRPAEIPGPQPVEERERTPEALAHEAMVEALRAELTTGEEPGGPRWLAGELIEYHRREARPAWWRWFALRAMDDDELVRDAEALGRLEPLGPPTKIPHNWQRTLSFPTQAHKVAPGDTMVDPFDGKSVPVVAVDDDACTVTVKANRFENDVPRGLIPQQPLRNPAQRDALLRLARSVRDRDNAYPALEAVLARDLPRFTDRPTGTAIQTTDLDEQQALARALDRSYLLVQGPPGTGKTYTGARLIVDLLRHGKRVGVTALSHRAINNLLAEVETAAAEANLAFSGARKAGAENHQRVPDGGQIANVAENGAITGGAHDLVAGTTWLFAPEAWTEQLDYLVIDEAGQLSLADALAAGTAAHNLILLGDPLQLPQVSQATHPVGTNASVLEHLLDDDPTVPENRGIFLTDTWRMHPDVCEFISREVYEGRLHAEKRCSAQSTGAGTGLRYLAVQHRGNASQSHEEADAVAETIATLVGRPYTDRNGTTRPLTPNDIMVVAPYNAQVRLLRQRLGGGVRVGTVDAFQGQEAPVVVFSMATSSGEDIPRDVAFLFSRNRLNVAISRARCLAILCACPDLLETRARTIDEMRLISTLCAFVEQASILD